MLPNTARRTMLVWSWLSPAALGICLGLFLVKFIGLGWALVLVFAFNFVNALVRRFVDTMVVYATFEKTSLPEMTKQAIPDTWAGDLVRPALRQFLIKPRNGYQWSLYHWIEESGPEWTHWLMRHVLGFKHFGEPLRALKMPTGRVRTWFEHDKTSRRWYICRQELPSLLDLLHEYQRQALAAMGYPEHMFNNGSRIELVRTPSGPIRGKTIDELHIDDVGPMEPPLKQGEEVVMVVSMGGAGPNRNGDMFDPQALKEGMGRMIRVKGRPAESSGARQRIMGVHYRMDAHKDETTEFGFPPAFDPKVQQGLRSVVADDGVSVDYVQDFDPKLEDTAVPCTTRLGKTELEAKIGERLKRFVGRSGSVELRKEIVAELMFFVPDETARPMEARVDDLMDICATACIPCTRVEAEAAIRTEDARTQEAKDRMIIIDEPHKP